VLFRSVGGFVEGWFQKENSKMYVSRGVGTSTLPVRFLCRPEVAIIQLEPL
jgi:predicted MPP superfamily phosphohydrolase